MSGVRAPNGLFHVREPLDELLAASARRRADLASSGDAAAARRTLEAAEAVARRRLASDVEQSGTPTRSS
jgi:hypothetical protein